jgi:CheY-like chemotaxis protein
VTGYAGPRRSLLVVDDHPTQRQMLAGLLLPLGFLVREAASGGECLERVRESCPDAVLLDITMDDMDGWETVRQLRAMGLESASLPVVMVSANAFENRPDKLAEAGAQAFVEKPVIESELLVALQRLLQLEWVADLRVPGWAAPTPTTLASPDRPVLPEEVLTTLTRLSRLGHLQGLHQALDQIASDHPAASEQVAAWRALVERCAFSELRQALVDAAWSDDEASA